MLGVHRWWGAERDRWDVGDIVRELGDQDSDIILPPGCLSQVASPLRALVTRSMNWKTPELA